MDARERASALWGLVAGLAFLVLVQAYDVLVGLSVNVGARFAVAGLVVVVAAGLSYLVDRWLAARASGDG